LHNNKFIGLLKTFNKKDIRIFRKILTSPYFNNDENLTILFDVIIKFSPKFLPKNLERNNLYKIAFPKKPYNEKQLGYYMSDLMRLGEKYCALQEFEENQVNFITKGLDNFLKRNLNAQFNSYVKEAEKVRKNFKFKNADFYFDKYKLEMVKHDSFNQQMKRANNELIYNSIKSLDTFYISEKLRLSCQILNRKNVFSVDFNDVLIDEIIELIESKDVIDEPAIKLYYHIYKAMKEPNVFAHFENLKESINANIGFFNEIEKGNIYYYAINYAIRKINSGEKEFTSELFDLYKTGLVNNIFFKNGILSPWTFQNIVNVGLRSNEVVWVENFIEEFSKYIHADQKENAYHFSKCNLFFHKKQFEKAHEQLLQIQFTNVSYHVLSKILLAKIYFELKEGIALFAHLDNFRVYIRKHKLISDSVKEHYLNFVSIIKKVYKADLGNKKTKTDLMDLIENKKNIPDSDWLLSKIES